MLYENNWASLNTRPVPAWFGKAKFGIFITWGLYSVPAYTGRGEYAEWYRYRLEHDPSHPVAAFHNRVYPGKTYSDFVRGFTAELFDADEWARLFRRSGARYIDFVSKFHDGFCMYPTKYAENWNSADIGPRRDFCMELRQAMEGTGVKFGAYHSLYEWNHPLYLASPERFAVEHLIPMLKEFVERYEPWTLFTDGEWEQTSATWHAADFLAWLYNESPVKDTIVPNDRWGSETRGRFGGNYTTEYGIVIDNRTSEDLTLDRPFEECRGIGRSFGLNRIEGVDDYMSAKECVDTLCSLVSKGGNLVLDIGPSADGRIPVIMEERLCQMGGWLRVNGEAVYDTDVYCPAPKDDLYYTKKDGRIYAILKKYPFGSVRLGDVPYSPHRSARLLALDRPVEIGIREEDGGTVLDFPPIDPEQMRSEWLYAVELAEPK